MFIGHTLNTSYGFHTCPAFAQTLGANFFQIFLGSPQQFNCKRRSKSDLIKLKENVEKFNMKFVVHANYMLNFCNPVDSYIHKQAVKLLVADLDESVQCGSIGVVIHMGKCCKHLKIDKEVAISNYVTGVRTCLNQSDKKSTVILETGAGVGTEVGTSLFDLQAIYNIFTEEEKKRIKFCIDTCHVFAAGYDLENVDYVDLFIDLISHTLGWENIACVHLNDSKCALNSKKDRHADLGKGLIGESGLKKFTLYCFDKQIPVVLETPCENSFSRKMQIDLVKSWVTSDLEQITIKVI